MINRRGRDFYSRHYDKVVELYKSGKSINDIAKQTGMSYSCVYHWVKGLRKPEEGNVEAFGRFLRENGPAPVAEISIKFPKHNEIFLTASRRGLPVKRLVLERKYGDYATWYFIEGDEDKLKKRVEEMLIRIKEIKDNIRKVLEEMDFTKLLKGEDVKGEN